MSPNEVAILTMITEKHALDSEQLIHVNDTMEEKHLLCSSLYRQGYLEQKRLGGLQVTMKGKMAISSST